MSAVCELSEIPPGSRKIVTVGRLSIGIFNVEGRLFALKNTCPHRGAPLCAGQWGGTMLPSDAGEYRYGSDGLVIRCPWHHWEYDLRTGRSLVDPERYRVKAYPVRVVGTSVVVETGGQR